MRILLILLLGIPGILVATTIHEFTRALVSTMLGDKLPKEKGRLTLNPVKHFEPIGFILMYATGFGWGKPVETSALYYKNRQRDVLLTAVMPTAANLICAVLFAVLYRLVGRQNQIVALLLSNVIHYNITLAAYNIVPVTPMDGLKVMNSLLPANTYFKYIQYEKVVQMLFLFLLFMGTTDIVFGPLIGLLEGIIYHII